ncbi:MAG: Na/Pi cotransporter family protein [Prolixibacteraceae bacterium]|nr:Na/Pi cotransporter family protein [Prolixibacteraceae bacterium]MBN2648529.1 Na/Pi cotransporter family protein [Prolixibacteraceae bacterium]
MNYTLFDLLRLIGSLAFFLFGMKLMSESLQKVAGDKMRSILGAMTSNRFKGIVTGVLITAIIQSSSATTVMVVSFVNAGLLSLVQSIGVIMGANIGTTVTAWLISLLGFKVDISAFALPLIGLSLPLVFSKQAKRRSVGELIVGFAMIFMGLSYLNSSVPDINSNPDILSFISNYSSSGYWSILFFLAVGTIITLVLQSSSASMALTLVMCYNGWIGFDMAVAMVLGQNIGTTITANLAALVANATAKQAAMAHLLFNVFGVILAMVFFRPFENLVLGIMNAFDMNLPNTLNGQSIQQANAAMPLALSIYHTVFNIINTLLLVWFVKPMAQLVKRIIRTHEEDDIIFKLNYINTGLLNFDELSALQARKEIDVFMHRTKKMYQMVKDMLQESKLKNLDKTFARVEKYEEIADRMDEEIVTFLTQITRSDVSKKTASQASAMIKLVSRVESISDSCYLMAQIIMGAKSKKKPFNKEMNHNIEKMFESLDKVIDKVENALTEKALPIYPDTERNFRDRINEEIEELNFEHLKDIKKGSYKYKVGILYCDFFSEQGVLADHCYHALKYIDELNNA